jgi:hypothetical protein
MVSVRPIVLRQQRPIFECTWLGATALGGEPGGPLVAESVNSPDAPVSGRCWRGCLAIHPLSQLPAWLEVRDELLRHLNLLPGLRIAAGARWAAVDRKTAEAADLDALALCQTQDHGSEYRIDHKLGILRDQLGIALGKPGNQFGFGHGSNVAQSRAPAFD